MERNTVDFPNVGKIFGKFSKRWKFSDPVFPIVGNTNSRVVRTVQKETDSR
jgi:hypothetical protein